MGMINISDAWSPTVLRKHAAYVSTKIDHALRAERGVGACARLFISAHRKQIILGSPAALRRVISCAEILKECLSADQFNEFSADCRKVFNYESFSARALPNWGGYALCEASRYSMCPYCHQAFAHTLVPDGVGSFRPTLDHYYPKSIYPYLALSIFNLVPSCYTCNSQLKGVKNFYEELHIHPLEEGSGEVDFVLNVRDYIEARRSGSGSPRVEVRPRSGAAINSISTFALNRRFALNAAYLDSFVARVLEYVDGGGARARVGCRIPFTLSEVDIIGFDAGNYRNEMLGKIKIDLYGILLAR